MKSDPPAILTQILVDPTDEQLNTAVHSLIESAFAFIRREYCSRDPATAQRLEDRRVIQRGEMMLRSIVEVGLGITVAVEADDSALVREEARSAAQKLMKIAQLFEEIPEHVQERFTRYTSRVEGRFFSSEVYNSMWEAIAYYRRHARGERGRKADVLLHTLTEECVRTLEHLIGRRFSQYFETGANDGGFLNPDCAFCEMILTLMNPALQRAEIKSALKGHFASPRPSSAKTVRKRGPSQT